MGYYYTTFLGTGDQFRCSYNHGVRWREAGFRYWVQGKATYNVQVMEFVNNKTVVHAGEKQDVNFLIFRDGNERKPI